MAYLSHDAWEAQLQGSKPRGSVLDSYNAGYDSYQDQENAAPQTTWARSTQRSSGRRQSWASPSDALRERRMITPVSPLEEADAQFERRASVKAAYALKSDLEDLMRQGLKSVGSDAREAKAATDYLKGDMELRRREYQETQNKCQTLELALESLRHESESKRDWFARRNAEKSEEEAWRRRVDADVAQLRMDRDDLRRQNSELLETVRRMAGGDDGGVGDVVARAQVQAHAAASAAVVPVQAHLERELSMVRRHVAALRAGGSFDTMQQGDVDDALKAERPSELLIKGVVAGAIADAELRLEAKLAKSLPVQLQPVLERHSARAAKDAEDQVMSKLQAAGTRGRSGLLAVLGGSDVFGAEAADASHERKRRIDDSIDKTEAHASLLRDLQEELRRTQDQVKNREAFLEDADSTRSREVEGACAKALAKAAEALDATKATQQFVDAAEAAARTLRDRDRAEVLQKCSVYSDEARADVSALRRQHADTLAAISQLEAKEGDRRAQAVQDVEAIPAVRRAAAAAARLDAVEEGVSALETHVRGTIETSLRERQGDLEVHDRRVARLEQWRDGADRVLGAEATLERLNDADNQLRKEDQSQNQRLAGIDEQLSALKAHAQSLQPQRVARVERDAQDALAQAQQASQDSDRRSKAQREQLEVITKKYEASLTSSKRQFETLEDKFRATQAYERRVATVETEQNDLRQIIQRHHGELAASQTLAVEKLAKEMRDLERDRRVELDGVRNVAKSALQRTDRVLVEIDTVARRVDALHSDVRLEHGRASFTRASSHFGDDKPTTTPAPPSSSSKRGNNTPGSVRTVLARGGGAPSASPTASSSDKSGDPLGRSRRVVVARPKEEPFESPAAEKKPKKKKKAPAPEVEEGFRAPVLDKAPSPAKKPYKSPFETSEASPGRAPSESPLNRAPYKSPFGNTEVPAPAPSPPLPGRASYTLPEETLPEPFKAETLPAARKPYRSPFSPASATSSPQRASTTPAAPVEGPAQHSPSNSDNSWDESDSDDDIAEAPQPTPSDDEGSIHIPTLGASPARSPVRRGRRTLADSHDSASFDDIPEIDTLDALAESVSSSPQYSSRLGRQTSVVEGADDDSFEESD